MNKEILIILTAAIPFSELRGSIPLGIFVLKEPVVKVIILSIIGNLIPVVPILFLLKPISRKLHKFPLTKRFFERLFERTEKNAKIVEKYQALGLMLFVAVPLPMTGAWTGCLAASLFKIRFRYAFLSIAAGIIIAALVVTMVSLGGKNIVDKWLF